jgi:hypothetical protein
MHAHSVAHHQEIVETGDATVSCDCTIAKFTRRDNQCLPKVLSLKPRPSKRALIPTIKYKELSSKHILLAEDFVGVIIYLYDPIRV